MCLNLALIARKDRLEDRFRALFSPDAAYSPYYHASGFLHPRIPVISQEDPALIQMVEWGLIPAWARDREKAQELRNYNFNAKSETIFEKPSFRGSIRVRRCLILADGFYEWHTAGGKKYPFFVSMKGGMPFAMGGIHDQWVDRATGEIKKTFSLITTAASPLMARIHNSKQRMPLVIPEEFERLWLNDISKEELVKLMRPFDSPSLAVHTVSKLLVSRKDDTNVPAVQAPHEYPELDTKGLLS